MSASIFVEVNVCGDVKIKGMFTYTLLETNTAKPMQLQSISWRRQKRQYVLGRYYFVLRTIVPGTLLCSENTVLTVNGNCKVRKERNTKAENLN